MEQTNESSAIAGASSSANLQLSINDDGILNASSVKDVYPCPYSSCNFTTTWKSSLNMHMRTHTGTVLFVKQYEDLNWVKGLLMLNRKTRYVIGSNNTIIAKNFRIHFLGSIDVMFIA